MRAHREEGGWRLTGDAPFVSGWGIVDVVQVSAGDVDSGDIVAAVLEARTQQPGITRVEPLSLVAADASRTVSLRLDELFVPDERVASRVPRPDFLASQVFGARVNGTLPGKGLVGRWHPDAGGRWGRTDVAGSQLGGRGRHRAGGSTPPSATRCRMPPRPGRRGPNLAVRAAAALVTAGGGPSLVRSHHAQRLARESLFTLVAASRAEVKSALLDRLSKEDRGMDG